MNTPDHFLRKIVDSLPFAMFCKDYTEEIGRFVAWNETAEKIWGLKEKEVLGKSDFDFFPKDQAIFFQEKDHETLESSKLVYIEKESVDSPILGKVFVRTWKVPVTMPAQNSKFLLGISQDITSQINLENQIEEQKLTIAYASKMTALGEMAGGIAHEINNPLSIILGFVEKIDSQLQDDPAKSSLIAPSVGKIKETIQRIKGVVDGLRHFSGDASLEEERIVNLYKIIQDTLLLCKERLKNERIHLELSYPDDKEIQIQCRPAQISQVMINLLNNARAAIENSDTKEILISVFHKSKETVGVRFIDSGPGVPEALQKRVFEPFFTTQYLGRKSGLGLSSSKGLMEKNNGKLYLEVPSKPTTFTIELPKVFLSKNSS